MSGKEHNQQPRCRRAETRRPPAPRRGWTSSRIGRWAARRLDIGFVLGAAANPCDGPFGFAVGSRDGGGTTSPRLRRHKGEYHGTVIAGTGAGKGVSCLIPAALTHPGQLICIDPRGEIATVTMRRRREMGDKVVIIDPFGELGPATDALNPLDLVTMDASSSEAVDDLCEMLACELGAGHEGKEPFWWTTATGLLSGVIAYAATHPDAERRTLTTVVDLLGQDDPECAIAVLLEAEGKTMPPFAYRRLAEFLHIPNGGSCATRGCVLATARQMLHCVQAERVRRTIDRSSVDLKDLLEGTAPVSIYILFSPSRVRSHRGLLRMWLATLTQVLLARREIPDRRTLLLIDETANLGRCDLLPLLYSYGRGFGVSCLTAWQSLGQMSDTYPGGEWRVIAENSIIQAFGLHATAIAPMAAFLSLPAEVLHGLAPTKQVVTLPCHQPEIIERIDYREHPLLAAMSDPNPRYRRVAGADARSRGN